LRNNCGCLLPCSNLETHRCQQLEFNNRSPETDWTGLTRYLWCDPHPWAPHRAATAKHRRGNAFREGRASMA
jgi:hypothetical protein